MAAKPPELKGLGKTERQALALLRRQSPGTIQVGSAAQILTMSRRRTVLLLSELARKGWLARVRRGIYLPVELDASSPAVFPEDPWVLASQILSPSYIGGWSAAEHWDLTEQIFPSTLVITTREVPRHSVDLLGARFHIRSCHPRKFFGTVAVWRGAIRVDASDLEKTVVDMLDDPAVGGGTQHAVQAIVAYWKRSEKNLERLLDYAKRMGNGAIFKRFGYLAETLFGASPDLLARFRRHLTAGYARLDPAVRNKGRLVRRWRLWVNLDLTTAESTS